MDRKLVAAALQMNSGDDVAANLDVAAALVAEAAGAGARLVVLPENFAGLSTRESLRREMAEADGAGPVQDALAGFAARFGIWVVGGTVPLRVTGDARPAAACCVYGPDGRRAARYDKIHLFDVDLPGSDERYRESDGTRPGESVTVMATPWGRLGLAVCYDLRFPELFRALAARGADVVAVPAAFTRPTGQAHWEVLLRARAIENLGYVLAAAQVGEHPGGRLTWGHSMVVGPWGEVLAEAEAAPGVCLAALDLDRPGQLRREFPVLQHVRMNPAIEAGAPPAVSA